MNAAKKAAAYNLNKLFKVNISESDINLCWPKDTETVKDFLKLPSEERYIKILLTSKEKMKDLAERLKCPTLSDLEDYTSDTEADDENFGDDKKLKQMEHYKEYNNMFKKFQNNYEQSQKLWTQLIEAHEKQYITCEKQYKQYKQEAETYERQYKQEAETYERQYKQEAKTYERQYKQEAETHERQYKQEAETHKRQYKQELEELKKHIEQSEKSFQQSIATLAILQDRDQNHQVKAEKMTKIYIHMLIKAVKAKAKRGLTNTATSEEIINKLIVSLPIPNVNFRMFCVIKKLGDNQKWRLLTGKVVEDTLFEYGRQCKSEHLSQSFIVDPEDTNYIAHGVFMEEELAEIEETDPKSLPDIPMDLMKYMNSFRQSSVKELRTQLSVVQDWEGASFKRESHFDYDWIKNSGTRYEGDNFVAGRSELHYLTHCWHIIDRCFLNLQDLHCVRGEASSFASSDRKNRTRHVSGLIQVARKMMGRRGDLIFRKHHNEYGNGEAGKQWEGEERGLKGAKDAKGYVYKFVLCGEVEHREGEEVAELNVLLLRLDSPRGYMCRVVRSPTYTIPQTVALFGQQVIPFLALVWKAKAIVKEVVESTQNRDSEEDQLQELQSVGVKRRKSYHFRIDDSVQTPSKKNKVIFRSVLLLASTFTRAKVLTNYAFGVQ
ncbi:hypothetical protein BC937DRAFT_92175 [Endogone sp. FLAS-F59071]|nr:hypothetical protein BC937DRAFT_92175 [Endogone sp. FLAS-F59071]|eukprot:RUS15655.1 hypothetical protein BC937DRAFT_92175 [Endogone sp. FLAS-F59071]